MLIMSFPHTQAMNSKLVLYCFVAVMMMTISFVPIVLQSYASATSIPIYEVQKMAPTVISGNNVYIVWFTNEGTVNSNYEVGFRASNDSGITFGPITNVSNTDDSDSVNAEISAEGGNIIVSWWEKNETSFLPFAKVSTDNGQTFGERLNITSNPFGTIGRTEGELTE
jgi:hypothetical protein